MNETSNAPAMAVQTRGTGPALVLFHGGLGSWNHWIRNLDALARLYTVHAVDLPGYGRSATIAKSASLTEYIDRVAKGLEPIVGAEPFRLAGFSFGAVAAAMTAERLGRQVLKLSLMGVGGFGPTHRLDMRAMPDESAGEAARVEVLHFNLCALMLADPVNVTDEAIRFYDENFRTARFDGRKFSLSNCVQNALKQITCPMQFIYGERDSLFGHDLQRRREIIHAAVPDTEFVIVPRAGHWVQYEAAEQVNALLLRFFA